MDAAEVKRAYETIGDDLLLVEKGLRDYLLSHVPIIPQVGEYMFLSGGKRFRPSLMLFSCKLAGYKGQRHIPLACTVEFLHTATLLHDDVVDDADMRRGKASVNSVWGNQASVLIGDFLLARSLSLLVADADPRILAMFCTTTEKMAEGEVLQLIQTGDPAVTEEDYFQVVRNKTASLISTACQVGAILGGLTDDEERALASFGLNIGIAFQLVDDTLDYVGRNDKFGKESGSDLRAGKMTLPLIHLLANGTGPEVGEVKRMVERGEVGKQDVGRVVALISDHGGIEYSMARAREYVAAAKRELFCFPENKCTRALMTVADYVAEREA